jgi:hypothetical protein
VFSYIKAVRSEECARVREDFENTFASRKAPESMVLAQARHAEPGYWCLIWLSAEKDSRALYRNFRAVGSEVLPKAATLLVGNPRTFEKFFTYEK